MPIEDVAIILGQIACHQDLASLDMRHWLSLDVPNQCRKTERVTRHRVLDNDDPVALSSSMDLTYRVGKLGSHRAKIDHLHFLVHQIGFAVPQLHLRFDVEMLFD
jgi:hypothetical protein